MKSILASSLAALALAAPVAAPAEDKAPATPPPAAAPAAAAPAQPRLGEKAPAFKLKTADGDKLSSGELLGHWTVLQFGSSWCPLTNRKAPNLEALGKKYKGKNVRCVVVDIAEQKSKVVEWAKKKGLTVPVLLDADGAFSASFAPPEMKTQGPRHELMTSSTVILDPQGRIRYFQMPNDDLLEANDLELAAAGSRLETLLAPPQTKR